MRAFRLGAALVVLAFPSIACAQDAAAGKQVFARCAMCHSLVPGKNGIGPSLAGVVGRKSATVANYSYSKAMAAAGLTWNKATLDGYLAKPQATVPGTKMPFAGLPNPADRQNLIAYLASVKP